MTSELLRGIGVIFDMDGVLVDSYAAHMRSWQLLGEELGRPVTESEFARTFGQTSRDIIRTLFGTGRTDADVRRLDDRKEALYRDLVRGRVPIMPGAVELLTALKSADARLAIGSSGPPENVRLIVEALAPVRFDAIVSGADVARGKPDPQVFLVAASQLSLRPSACVVIEDAPVGIEAAHRAGMKGIALSRSGDRAKLASADMTISSLTDLRPEIVSSFMKSIG